MATWGMHTDFSSILKELYSDDLIRDIVNDSIIYGSGVMRVEDSRIERIEPTMMSLSEMLDNAAAQITQQSGMPDTVIVNPRSYQSMMDGLAIRSGESIAPYNIIPDPFVPNDSAYVISYNERNQLGYTFGAQKPKIDELFYCCDECSTGGRCVK